MYLQRLLTLIFCYLRPLQSFIMIDEENLLTVAVFNQPVEFYTQSLSNNRTQLS